MSRSSMKVTTVRPCTPVHIYMYMYTVKYVVHMYIYNIIKEETEKTDMERGYSSCPHLESNLH